MAVVLKYVDNFNTFLDKYSDPRVINWFLMPSPIYIITICISYVLIVKIFGPKFMEHRKPFQLRNVLIVYNLFQVIFNAWIFYMCLTGGWLDEYSLRCQPVDFSNSPKGVQVLGPKFMEHRRPFELRNVLIFYNLFQVIFNAWIFYMCLTGGWLDEYSLICQPVDFSNSPNGVQVSQKYKKNYDYIYSLLGGHASFTCLLNTFVHVVMYFYYLLAAFGPQVQKYLWWKKYLTTLQIVQFALIIIHTFQLLFVECNFPRTFVWIIGLETVMFIFMFSNFYSQTYNKREKLGQARDAGKYYKNDTLSALNRRTKIQ
ncbi:hypothetical protein FQR65_LT02944 [Abscondita terminalis]|nr:hypothetical protein FQR65_LT02944 [Abscondita terminalis]